MGEKQPLFDPRNARLREVVDPYLDSSVKKLLETFPWFTANRITYTGVLGVAAGATLAAGACERNSVPLRLVALSTLLLGHGMDGLDGKAATILGTKSKEGALLDLTADRTGEFMSIASEMFIAQKKGRRSRFSHSCYDGNNQPHA